MQSSRKYQDRFCKILVVDGKQFLATPDGHILPGQILTRVTDSVDQPTTAFLKLLVELEDTENKGDAVPPKE